MKTLLIAITALAVLPVAGALAGDDCHVPRGAWQPHEAVMQAAAGLGWHVEKIEADDGCWEVKGRDAQGRRIKAKLDPATLQVVKLRHRDGEQDRKRDRGGATPVAPSAPSANPLFQNGTPPVVRVN
ncbi:PepSY domain-containing protein [Paracoccus sp. SSJ]|uniref:PepSY domain-containing protein n=1 Tax=Paracoccus sp. SSJ TaxID=3050636 RepID=UPI00254D4E0B|nr:PepSY domain-containing protein [Paracoccus sp. SSJ]MDK8875255.1 PepSY domain-containing protein [Paracoccus sp. SSJ]